MWGAQSKEGRNELAVLVDWEVRCCEPSLTKPRHFQLHQLRTVRGRDLHYRPTLQLAEAQAEAEELRRCGQQHFPGFHLRTSTLIQSASPAGRAVNSGDCNSSQDSECFNIDPKIATNFAAVGGAACWSARQLHPPPSPEEG